MLSINGFRCHLEKEDGIWFVISDDNGGILGSGETKSSAIQNARDNF